MEKTPILILPDYDQSPAPDRTAPMRILRGEALQGSLPGQLLAVRFHHGGPRGKSIRYPARSRRDHAEESAGWRVRPGLPGSVLHGGLLAEELRRIHQHPACPGNPGRNGKALGGIPKFSTPPSNGKKVAVIGGGPAGLGAAAALAQMGYAVDIFEGRSKLGGMMNLIPDQRLDKKVVQTDIEFLLSLGAITAKTGTKVEDPLELFEQGYEAVCVTAGLWKPIELGIENENLAIKMVDLLSNPPSLQLHRAAWRSSAAARRPWTVPSPPRSAVPSMSSSSCSRSSPKCH